MAPFFCYIDYCKNGRNPQKRIQDIVLFIDDFFDKKGPYEYFIMDPYFNVESFLKLPFESNKIDENIWSNLIVMLSDDGASFQIITNDEISLDKEPTKIRFPENESVNILAVYYPNCKMYEDYKLHDRYILRKLDTEIKGLHIGPSLSDIHNKDVTITAFDDESAEDALRNFREIWTECERTKGWAKN